MIQTQAFFAETTTDPVIIEARFAVDVDDFQSFIKALACEELLVAGVNSFVEWKCIEVDTGDDFPYSIWADVSNHGYVILHIYHKASGMRMGTFRGNAG